MGVRKAGLAGSWYPGDDDELAEEVESCLGIAAQCYGMPVPKPGTVPVALVAPHAGLFYSGPVAAVAYGLVKEALASVDTFVVFGACHRVRLEKPAIWAEGAWETPLGNIEIDEDLARALVETGVGAVNESAHHNDNAVELQTPFIKYLFPDAKMVPVAMSSFPDSWRYGEEAARAAMASGKRVVAVASTDLTHYGASFGVTPAGVGEPALEWTRENDHRFLSALLEMDAQNIVRVAERDASACGGGAAAAAAGWASERGCRKGRLLAHTNSHEIAPQMEAEHFVGYASLVYEAEG